MKMLNWGLIGAGDIARKRIAPALRDLPNCNLVAVSRNRAELAEDFAREFGAKKWFADWRKLVADEEIETVYIATPVFLHKEQTIAAAENGKHILCEKPMALNAKDCAEMIAVCGANNVKLGIAYYRRFYPVIWRIKEIIASGEIGKPVIAQINAFEYFNPAKEHPRFWLLQKEKSGGGPMMDFGCHRLEILSYLFGKISGVEAFIGNAAFERETEDTATAILQFQNGLQANITVTHAAFEPQDTLEIFGTLGTIRVPVLNESKLEIKTSKRERTENHPNHENVHAPLIEEFTNAVLENRKPRVAGETGKLIAELEDVIYKRP